MTRSIVLAFLLLVALPMTASIDMDSRDFVQDLVNFNVEFNEFFRAKLGCPQAAARLEDCDEKLGHFDYRSYARAAELAKKVFPK